MRAQCAWGYGKSAALETTGQKNDRRGLTASSPRFTRPARHLTHFLVPHLPSPVRNDLVLPTAESQHVSVHLNITRNSAIADKPRDAFRGQSRTPNMLPFHMLGIISY